MIVFPLTWLPACSLQPILVWQQGQLYRMHLWPHPTWMPQPKITKLNKSLTNGSLYDHHKISSNCIPHELWSKTNCHIVLNSFLEEFIFQIAVENFIREVETPATSYNLLQANTEYANRLCGLDYLAKYCIRMHNSCGMYELETRQYSCQCSSTHCTVCLLMCWFWWKWLCLLHILLFSSLLQPQSCTVRMSWM